MTIGMGPGEDPITIWEGMEMGRMGLGSTVGLGDQTRMDTERYLGEGRKRCGTTCGSIILRSARGQRSRRGTTWWRVDGTLETRALRFAGLPL